MLIFKAKYAKSKYVYGGSGIFDIAKKIIQKSANSGIGKKVINSATTENLKKVANSSFGQEIKKSILAGVSEASNDIVTDTAKRVGLPVSNKRRIKRTPTKAKKRKGNGIVLD